MNVNQIVTLNDVEYRYVGRCNVDQFMPGDLIGNADLLVTKSEPSPDEPDGWTLTWHSLADGDTEQVEWVGGRTAADARYVPAQYVIEETP